MRTFEEAAHKVLSPLKLQKSQKKQLAAIEAFQKSYDYVEDMQSNEALSKIAARFIEGMPICCPNHVALYIHIVLLSGFQLGLAVGIEMEKSDCLSTAE